MSSRHTSSDSLSQQWVKRQRYSLRQRGDGIHSTLTPEREGLLNEIDFVWDPHAVFWTEKLEELRKFREEFGHCNVPTKYEKNPQLSIWAKCQRRQYKLYLTKGPSKSNMTADRIKKLNELGFVFDPRSMKSSRSMSSCDLRQMLKMNNARHQKRTSQVSAARRFFNESSHRVCSSQSL